MTYASITEPPSIYPFSIESGVRLGERLGLQCLVTKGDTPISIHWLKDEDEVLRLQLPSVMVRDLGEFSSTLLIEQLSTEHSGRYTCQASNHAATASHSVVVAVNGTSPTACSHYFGTWHPSTSYPAAQHLVHSHPTANWDTGASDTVLTLLSTWVADMKLHEISLLLKFRFPEVKK
jgi:hypothetical protein